MSTIEDKLDTEKIKIFKKAKLDVATSLQKLEDIIIPEVSSPLRLSAVMIMTFAEKSYKSLSSSILYRH